MAAEGVLPGDRGATWHRAVAVGCLAGVWAGLAHGVVDSGYFVVDLAWSLALVAGMIPSYRSTWLAAYPEVGESKGSAAEM